MVAQRDIQTLCFDGNILMSSVAVPGKMKKLAEPLVGESGTNKSAQELTVCLFVCFIA